MSKVFPFSIVTISLWLLPSSCLLTVRFRSGIRYARVQTFFARSVCTQWNGYDWKRKHLTHWLSITIIYLYAYYYSLFSRTGIHFCKGCLSLDKVNQYSYNGEILNRPRLFDIVSKNWLFCWNSWKNIDRGANKALTIHKKNESRFLKRGNNSNIKLSILYLCLNNCQNMQWDKTVYFRKNWLFCWNSWKNNDRGANKSLIIHKTSQNNRNNIIWSCIWVKSHTGV
jgi:hypothetical protein